jgi:hypothetical protein
LPCAPTKNAQQRLSGAFSGLWAHGKPPVSRSDVSGYFLFVITKMQIKLHWPPAFVCCEQLALNK